jgi:hypothetical protein
MQRNTIFFIAVVVGMKPSGKFSEILRKRFIAVDG